MSKALPLMDPETNIETDPVEAKRTLRKIDWRIIPLLQFLYMLTFLDRFNIGNARLWNLEKDLNLTGYEYNIIVLVFYIPYIILELPANYVFNRVEPRKFISVIIFGWGLTMTFAGFCHNFAGLLVSRIFVGIFESGMFPRLHVPDLRLVQAARAAHPHGLLLCRQRHRRHHLGPAGCRPGLARRRARHLGGGGGSFFTEGTGTCLAALLAWVHVPPFPEDSTFLTEPEKQWAIRRLQADNRGISHEKMTTRGVLNSLKDWKFLSSGVLYLAVCTTAYSISVFQPTILRTFGWGDLKSNLLSAPPRVASGIVSVALGIWSDRIQKRGIFCVFGFSLSIIGLFLVMFLTAAMRYIGIYFAAIGIYIVQPLSISW
ncbi:hypothetical protein FJTKL_12342 [Diaporthe vaccinii]|uniref:Major facilitator superfamily (MFS) profile domain-containing protein n=1 Tax=Diaporthe vaccinii TaxID=105482 RepID=A0ABR4EDV2_9PEZI